MKKFVCSLVVLAALLVFGNTAKAQVGGAFVVDSFGNVTFVRTVNSGGVIVTNNNVGFFGRARNRAVFVGNNRAVIVRGRR